MAVSADAMQVYDGLPILTGAATPASSSAARAPAARGGAGERAVQRRRLRAARACGDRRARSPPGGGRSSWAAPGCTCAPRWPSSTCARRCRRGGRGGRRRWRTSGPEALHAELTRRAPEVAAGIAPADGKRLVRTLELLDAGEAPPGGGQLWTTDTRHPTLLAGLVMDRAVLAERIGERVDRMVADGARAEVERAAATASPTARKALGFEELLAGDVEAMKARTRRYAKRQLTWMRKLPDVRTLDVTGRDPADVAAELHGMIEP